MNILWVEKIKAKFVDVIKEYLFSISVFLLATVFWTIRGDGINHSYIIKTVIPFLETFFTELHQEFFCARQFIIIRIIPKRKKLFFMQSLLF